MIRASGTANGRPLMVLGLSDENMQRIRNGQPIEFDAAELGIDCRVLIVGGKTEDGIRGQLGEWFSVVPDADR